MRQGIPGRELPRHFLMGGFMIDLILPELIEQTRKERFNPKYWNQVSDAEVLGVILANHFKWDGKACFDTLTYALEDSNFHSENRALAEAWRQAQAARA